MAIRDPWAVGTSSFDAEEIRVAQAAAWTPGANAVKALTGIRPGPNNPAGVTASATPDGYVHVAPFQLVLHSTRSANGGAYTFTSDTTVDINILATPADATFPRSDLVIVYIPDTFYGDANSTPVIRSVTGTPSGFAGDPSLAAFPDAVVLARIRVNPNNTTIPAANIADLRPAHTVALGGLLPTANATTRNALTGTYDGMQVYRRDRDWIEVHDGSAWRVPSVPTVSSFADLAAITSPYEGQVVFSGGDSRTYRYAGGEWRNLDLYRSFVTLAASAPSITFSAIPYYLRTIQINGRARGDIANNTCEVNYRINGSTGAFYRSVRVGRTNTTTIAAAASAGLTYAQAGNVAGGSAAVGVFGSLTLFIDGWNMAGTHLAVRGDSGYVDLGGYAQIQTVSGFSGPAPYTSVTLLPLTGNFVAGTSFTLVGWD